MPIPKKLAAILTIFLIIIISVFAAPKISQIIEKKSIRHPKPYDASTTNVKTVTSSTIDPKTHLITYPQDHVILMVGDSMTELLGNSDELKGYLQEHYPRQSFEVLNYGYGATSLLSLQDRLEKNTFNERDFKPILSIDFDVILIESFGNNPLSEFPLPVGLKKQREILDKAVATIRSTHPQAKIVFVATIAPNKETYALGDRDLAPDVRIKWAEERMAYIQNHIDYANEHKIPLIDIYHKSMDSSGDGKAIFINTTDHIHPSPTGILFISREIADYLYNNQLL